MSRKEKKRPWGKIIGGAAAVIVVFAAIGAIMPDSPEENSAALIAETDTSQYPPYIGFTLEESAPRSNSECVLDIVDYAYVNAMSEAEIRERLADEYTQEQIDYAFGQTDIQWNTVAADEAIRECEDEYLSRYEVANYLLDKGFTEEQAAYVRDEVSTIDYAENAYQRLMELLDDGASPTAALNELIDQGFSEDEALYAALNAGVQ